MISTLLIVLAGIVYLLFGGLLLILSLWLFEYWTHFDVRHEIFHVQNPALSGVVRGMLIAQGIIITAVIYFTGHTPEQSETLLSVFFPTLGWTLALGLLGMFVLQGAISLLFRIPDMEKEILIDQNTALSAIIEGGLMVFALIIAVSFYSYYLACDYDEYSRRNQFIFPIFDRERCS